MRIKIIYCILLVPLLLCAGCPQFDSDDEIPQLEIWQNIPGGIDTELRVLDIDPGAEGKIVVYLKDPSTNVQIPGNFSVDSASVFVEREDAEFAISGLAGGMGVVTFSNRQGSKEANLHVFVRNWKKSDVYRHTLEPDPSIYRFRPNRQEGETYSSSTAKENSYAIYQLIVDRGYHYESPDGVSSRNTGVHGDTPRVTSERGLHNLPHIFYFPQGEYPYDPADPLISAAWKEPFLRKPVFAFVLHYGYDGDMVGGYADRQRLELKTMDSTRPPNQQGSADIMYSRGGGDTFTHRWKFMLPKDFRVSTEYTHIHQLKPEGADNGNPTITLTARKLSNNQEVMQLIYRGPIRELIGDREIPSVNWYPAQVPLDPFRGEWIRVEETVTYDSPGAYKIKVVRIRDMRVLMEYEYDPAIYDEEDPFVMFRKGNTYIRKKSGVYRRIMHMTPFGLPNREDPVLEYYAEGDEMKVLYTDFEMDKWKD